MSDNANQADRAGAPKGRIVVIGNEKGGTGKSTTAMHLIVGALREDLRVASIDLDIGQSSLSRYIQNRQSFAADLDLTLAMPDHLTFEASRSDSRAQAAREDRARLQALLDDLAKDHDVVFVDCPGSDAAIAHRAIALADVLITPLNDSLVDLDLLVRLEGEPPEPEGPSRYSEAVWEQRKIRAQTGAAPIDWIVLRNRVGSLSTRNQRLVHKVLSDLARRYGFRLADGFGERVIYREMFVQGLTVLDLREEGTGVRLNMSHLAARQEVRRLLEFIGLTKRRTAEPEAAEIEPATSDWRGP